MFNNATKQSQPCTCKYDNTKPSARDADSCSYSLTSGSFLLFYSGKNSAGVIC